MLRKASPERVRSRVRDEDEAGRSLSGNAAWLLLLLSPASFAKALPIYSYSEHELILKHDSTASTMKERNLERHAEGHGCIFFF